MNAQLYWRNLNQRHQQSMAATAGPGAADQNLNLILAGVCALAALILIATGDHKAGFDAVHRVGGYLPVVLLETVSKFGETFAAVCLISFVAQRQPRALWMGALASVYGTTLTHVLKSLCDTARPAAELGDWVVAAGPVLKLHSFPSGHTMTAFLLAACLSVGVSRNTKVLLSVLAAVVGSSRVWIGAHWPLDVIAGAGLAGLSIALAIRTLKFADCGLRLAPHLFLVSLIAVCAVGELVTVSGGLLARLLSVTVAVPALSILARDYVLRPLLLGRAGTHATAISSAPPGDVAPPRRCSGTAAKK